MGARLILVLVLIVSTGGCTRSGTPTGTVEDEGDSFVYSLRGRAPIISPWLPMSVDDSPTIEFQIGDEHQRVDSRMNPQETRRVSVVTSDGKEHANLFVTSDLRGLIQAQVSGIVPAEVGELVLVRDASEAWCFFGSAFYGRPLVIGERISILHYSGNAIEFFVDSTDPIQGRDALVLVEVTDAHVPYKLWVDPELPCPLKGMGRHRLGDLRAEADQFAFDLVRLPEQVEIASSAQPANEPPLVELAAEPASQYGLPPDGALQRARFGLLSAFEHAREYDAPFRDYLVTHRDPVLVRAEYMEMHPDVRTYRIWTLEFADLDGEGYFLSVHREALARADAPPLTRVVDSRSVATGGAEMYAKVIAEGTPTLTLSSAREAGAWLTGSSDGFRLSYEVRGEGQALIFLHVPHTSTMNCTLVSCAGTQVDMTLTFEAKEHLITSFAGPVDVWTEAHREKP